MTFDTFEKSVQDGAPIEAFEFIGTNASHFMTSYASTFSLLSNSYTPTAIQRKSIKIGTQAESQLALEVSLPFDNAMVKEFAYSVTQPKLELTLRRVHLDSNFATDSVIIYKGRVTAFSVKEETCRLQIPTIFGYILQGNAPTPRFQRICNHRLFDARCKVNPVTHQHATTVVSVNETAVQVATQPLGNTLIGGKLTKTSTGEARMIVAQSGTTLTITYPFSVMAISEPVAIERGCDHALLGNCKNLYNNTVNYGGNPTVPARNPFGGSLT